MLKKLFLCFSLVGALLLPALPVQSQTTESISQSFSISDSNISNGALVSIVSDRPSTVELASTTSSNRLIGVVTNDPLLTLSEGENTVQVTIAGKAELLVSDINGEIKAGNVITASPLEGIGMKASADGQVVGVALADMTIEQSEVRHIKDTTGKEHDVHVGFVPLQIDVSYYIAPTSGILPPFLQNLANAVAGKQVSVLRVLLAAGLMISGVIGVSVLLYSAARAGIISIGRNPLAATSIQKGILQVGATSVAIVGFVVIGAYLTITL